MNSSMLKLSTDKAEVALHLVLSQLTVSLQTMVETVFLSKLWSNTLESILIEHCQCSSTSVAFAVCPS